MKITALHICAEAIKYLAVNDGNVIASGRVPLPEGTVKNGLVLQPETAGQRIKALFAGGDLPQDKIVCSLGGLPFTYRFFTLPRMESSSLDEAVSRAAGREMPAPAGGFYLSWQAFPAGENEWRVLASGVSRTTVDALMKAFKAAGVKPHSLCLPEAALPAAAGRRDAVIVDFTPEYSNVVLVVNGMPAGMQTAPTLDSGASLEEQAEHLSRNLTLMTGFYNDKNPDAPLPSTLPLVLTGELSHGTTVSRILADETGFSVEQLQPPVEIRGDGLSLEDFAVNAGAVLLQGARTKKRPKETAPFKEINFNGIVKERERDRQQATIKRTLLAAALVIGIIFVGTAYRLDNSAKEEILKAQSALQQANTQLASLGEMARQATQTETEIKNLISAAEKIKDENLAALARNSNVDDLDFVTKSLPPATAASSVELTASLIVIRGSAADRTAVVDYVKTVEKSGRFEGASINWIDEPAEDSYPFMITVER